MLLDEKNQDKAHCDRLVPFFGFLLNPTIQQIPHVRLNEDNQPEFIYWTPSETHVFAGPADLAKVICEYRDWHSSQSKNFIAGMLPISTPGNISGVCLAALLHTAYNASFINDEGRYTRCVFVVDSANAGATGDSVEKKDSFLHCLDFCEPVDISDGAKQVSKLSTALVHPDSMFKVIDSNGVPMIDALVQADFGFSRSSPIGRPRRPRNDAGLSVQVVGPGEILVKEGVLAAIKANRIVTYSNISGIEPIFAFLFALASDLSDDLSELMLPIATSIASILSPIELFRDMIEAISIALSEAIRLKHGGCFVFVPSATNQFVKCDRYSVQEFDIIEMLKQLWILDNEIVRQLASKEGKQAFYLKILEKLQVSRDYVAKLESIGHGSSIDGCVVFDHQLRFHGIAGSIEVGTGDFAAIELIDGVTKTKIDTSVFGSRYGERHKSAATLCGRVEKAIALVVSSDGTLRVLCEKNGSVLFFDDCRI